jgi:hypothetical protein
LDEEIVQQEEQVREKVAMTNDTLHKFLETWLEQAILDKFWESHRNESHDILAKEQNVRKAVGTFSGANTKGGK